MYGWVTTLLMSTNRNTFSGCITSNIFRTELRAYSIGLRWDLNPRIDYTNFIQDLNLIL